MHKPFAVAFGFPLAFVGPEEKKHPILSLCMRDKLEVHFYIIPIMS